MYISHEGPLAPGSTETITPKNAVYVWFTKDFEDQSMVDQEIGDIMEVDMGGKTGTTVAFNSEGVWVNM